MATYKVVFRADRTGHDVMVKDDNGGRHMILGFKTAEATRAWITVDQRLSTMGPPESKP